MQLYAGRSRQFIEDTVLNRISEKLKESFFKYFRYAPSPNEVRSWHNSLSRICNVIQYAALNDQGIILEYRLPLSSKRLDFLITGSDKAGRPNTVIVELKQWDEVAPSEIEDCVVTYVGKGKRDVLHPSRQVGNYQLFLENCHTAFNTGAIGITSCSYLHNLQYDPNNEIYSSRHAAILKLYPAFAGDQTHELATFLNDFVGEPDNQNTLGAVAESKYRAGKKLLEHTSAVIKGEKAYILLDEQQVVFNAVLEAARKGIHNAGKVAILINGGPGTGKSVIALNLVAELCGLGYNAQHATGSKAFTENVRKIVGPQASLQFKFFAAYQNAEQDAIDVLVLDEAHRMFATGNTRWTPRSELSNRPLIEHIIEAAKVPVFFIDDLQVVRPDEVGRASLIRETCAKLGIKLLEYELEAQFRCNGSDAFINWIDNTLGIRKTADVLWNKDDPFDFKIVESVEELEALIRSKQTLTTTARLAAGFCWKWSKPDSNGHPMKDVVVGRWSMPWNAKPDATRLAANIPKSYYWASNPNGVNQVGCIYTAQNFEFDYIGVIFGLDIKYDPKSGTWIGDRTQSHDTVVRRSKEQFVNLVKNTYRVLLTRGLKGCYVYFMDENTRNFFQSRLE